jgi:hypothetical protein
MQREREDAGLIDTISADPYYLLMPPLKFQCYDYRWDYPSWGNTIQTTPWMAATAFHDQSTS